MSQVRTRRGKVIEIDGKVYNSIKDAANKYGFNATYLCRLIAEGKTEYKNKTFKVLPAKETKKVYKKAKDSCRACPVKCITTNEIFTSISEAAKSAKAKMWTMSLKMEKAGKFIDKEGKEYIRLEPMKSKDLSMYDTNGNCLPYLAREPKAHGRTNVFTEHDAAFEEPKDVIDILSSTAIKIAETKRFDVAAKLYALLDELSK